MLLGQFIFSAFFVIIFTKGYEGKGWQEGFRYGLLIGPLVVAGFFIFYAVTPMPISLMWSWIVGGLIQSILGGIFTSLIYKNPTA